MSRGFPLRVWSREETKENMRQAKSDCLLTGKFKTYFDQGEAYNYRSFLFGGLRLYTMVSLL